MAVRSASSAGSGLAGSRLSRISPRARCSSASNARWPIRSDVASASSRIARARPRSPARGFGLRERNLARVRRRTGRFARAAVRRRDACRRARGQARRSQRSPSPRERRQMLPTSEDHARARAGRVRKRSARRARGRHASIRTGPSAFSRMRACRHGARAAIRVSASSTREIARPTSPNGHNVLSRGRASRRRRRPVRSERPDRRRGRVETRLVRVPSDRALRRYSPANQMGDPGGAVGDSGLGRIGFRLDVAEERRRVRPHRRQLAARIAADPQAVVGRQSSGASLSPTADSRALAKASVVSGAPMARAAISALP